MHTLLKLQYVSPSPRRYKELKIFEFYLLSSQLIFYYFDGFYFYFLTSQDIIILFHIVIFLFGFSCIFTTYVFFVLYFSWFSNHPSGITFLLLVRCFKISINKDVLVTDCQNVFVCCKLFLFYPHLKIFY